MVALKRRLPPARELRALGATLRSPAPYAVFALALLILTLAYQVRPSYHLAPGKTDGAFWSHINDRETDPNTQQTYRWTTAASTLLLPGVGRGDYLLRLDLSGARPPGQPGPFFWPTYMADVSVASTSPVLPAHRTVLEYHLTADHVQTPTTSPLQSIDTMPDGNLRVTLHTGNPFSPPGDPRTLGVVVYSVDVIPEGSGWVLPPLGTVLPLALAAALLALVLGLLGWGPAGVRAGGLVGAVAVAGFLLGDRLFLTPLAGLLPVLLLGAGGLLLVLGPLWRALYRAGGIAWPACEQRGLLGLFAATWLIRLAGQLHPQIAIIDLIFHQHRFQSVLDGQLLFQIQSDEWGGRYTFYLPTPYVLMLPLQALLNDQLLTLRLFTVTLDSLSVFLVYYLAKRAFGDGRAGLLAAVLSVSFPIAILPFSWGITANLFGQFTGLAAITLLVGLYDRLTRPGPWLLLTVVLTLALLSHPGSVQLTGLTVGGLIVVWGRRAWWPRRRPLPPTPSPTKGGGADGLPPSLKGRGVGGADNANLPSLRRGGVGGEVGARAPWIALVAALLVAGGLAWFGYYQHFAAAQLQTLGEIRIERATEAQLHGWSIKTGGEVNDASIGLRQRILTDRAQWLPVVAQDFAAEAWAYFHTLPLLLAPLGFWIARRPRDPADPTAVVRRRMLAAAAVWAAVGVAYAIIGAAANLYVRYPLFLAPLVALGSGLFLSALWDRGRGGRLLAILFLTATVAEGLLFWYIRILYANK
ncbi:MAG: hypothetical protein M3Z04_12755 [Chloroflexota bacterium]|nr:hypothetical protein [Chloroflexota bacterium]